MVGAGPAGLVAAIAGRMHEHEVHVFEQAPDFARVGGGVMLHSNGQRVLEKLGLLESFRPHMRLTQKLAIELPDGKVLQTADYGKVAVRHNQAAVVLRYELQEHLLAHAMRLGVPVHFGRRCEHADGAKLSFTDGSTAEAEVVIAADGIHSKVRACAGLVAEEESTGQAFIRAVAPLPTDDDRVREILSPDGRRFGICPLPGARTYFFCRVPFGWNTTIAPDATRRAEWIDSWHAGPDAERLLRSVEDWSRASYDELHELHLERWSNPPTFVVGDAAHAMTPNLGQGANSAMVDSLVLMQLLAEQDDLSVVAREYEALRRPFVTKIQKTAHRMGSFLGAENAPARWLRDLALQLGGRSDWLMQSSLKLMAGYQPAEERFLATDP